MSYPTLNRGSTSRSVPSQYLNSQVDAPFSINSPPGGFDPSTGFSSVPGILTGQPPTAQSLLGVPAVRATSGAPSQQTITAPYVTKPWGIRQYENRQGRGQALFVRRKENKGDDIHTVASLPQLNDILRESYKKAVAEGVVERAVLDADTTKQVAQKIEFDMMDGVGRQRYEIENSKGNTSKRTNFMARMGNVNEKYWMFNDEYREQLIADRTMSLLRTMSLYGIMETWNYLGICQNVERVDSAFKVLNAAVGGPMLTDNYWGDGVSQSAQVYLVAKRLTDRNGEPKEFAFVPWIENQEDVDGVLYTKYPPDSFLRYEDEAGYTQYGCALSIGKVARVDGPTRQRNKSSQRLVGAASHGVPAPRLTPELDAWAESSSSHKSKVFLTLNRDPYNSTGV